jgi:FAD/FMN-containing dehydrogenase
LSIRPRQLSAVPERLQTLPPTGATSWGRYPAVEHRAVVAVDWPDLAEDLFRIDGSVLPYGLGRSYGDSCLNEGGVLLDTSRMRRFISFDAAEGVLRCEAGVTLADILDLCVPRGWFLPTTPGTKFVTVGGAIANDVHGKNHHVAGTFGRHVTKFELLRSDGQRYVCSPSENAGLFRATIGGLGLTGLILWAEIRLRRVSGPYIDMESVRFGSLEEFFEVSADSDRDYEFTMSWIDCAATGRHLGRGLFMRGNHAWQPRLPGRDARPKQRFGLPFDLPTSILNGATIRAFNAVLYHKQLPRQVRSTVPYDPFFYPLDSIGGWNRMYGNRGFLQHQCVIPHESARKALGAILDATSRSGQASFLSVLKAFGEQPPAGMMSFPRPGATLAMDFAFHGEKTLRLLDALDEIVLAHGGAVYPAKDARMSRRTFEASFPGWRDFLPFVDERFSSSFWRRVTGTGAP